MDKFQKALVRVVVGDDETTERSVCLFVASYS